MLIHWLSQQIQPALDGLRQIRRAPLSACVTAAVIGITLTFPAVLKVIIDNGATVSEHLKQTATLTVYLKQSVRRNDVSKLAQSLSKRKDILAVQPISPSEGLQQLEQTTALAPEETALPDNPLPWVIIITPKASIKPTETLTQLKTDLTRLPDVDTIQIDTQWTTRLEAILKTAQHIMIALTTLLGFAVLLITGNTIWAVIRRHSREIQIIRLTGGTARFIRRPFLYAGAIYGLLGAVLALISVSLLVNAFTNPIRQLAALCDSPFSLTSLSITDTASVLAGGMLLGFMGAWLAVTRYLYSLETR